MQAHSLLGNLPLYALVAIVFLLMISVLVFAHELGHYLFARLFNMGVEEFAIGFGKNPLITYARKNYVISVLPGEDVHAPHGIECPDNLEKVASFSGMIEGASRTSRSTIVETPNGTELHETTDFTVRPLPLGGFVRIKGMLPEEDGSETKIPGGFYSKAPWKRFIVLFAGPAFSVLAGILVLIPVFMADGITKLDNRPIIGDVIVGKPADKAGLRPGDEIIALQGKPVHRFYDVIQVVRVSPGIDLPLTYKRAGKIIETSVRPEADKVPSPILDEELALSADYKIQAKIFAGPMRITTYPSAVGALNEAVKAPIDTIVGIFRIFQKPARFENSVNGPVKMVQITSDLVQAGVLKVMTLAAYLSISVGIFNLLPFPPLDGGQMAIAFAEMLRGGRRLSIQIQGAVGTAGLLAVMLIMVSALYVDFKQISTSRSNPNEKPLTLKSK